MATLYGSGKGCVRVMAGLQLLIGVIMFVFGVVVAVLVCHWTSKAGLGIWIGIIVIVTASVGLYSCSVNGQQMITWYSWLSIFVSILTLILCLCYGMAMADFFDEMTSDNSPVDRFYSRQYVAIYMRTHYYRHCTSSAIREEIEKERTGVRNIVEDEKDEERNLLIDMEIHGRKAIGFAATLLCVGAIAFIFATSSVMYACTAAGWFIKDTGDAPSKSSVTIHHSQASQVFLR